MPSFNIHLAVAVKYCQNNKIENKVETDYEKGVFLHLATDFIFYQEFLSDEYLAGVDYDGMIQDLYYSYRISNPYLEEKYNIHALNLDDVMNQNIKQTLKRMNVDNSNGFNLLPEEKMDNFINKMSKLDLNSYIEKIKNEDKNVFPDNYVF